MPPRREIAGGCAEFAIRYSIPHHAPGTIVREKRKSAKEILFRHFLLCFSWRTVLTRGERWRTQRARRCSPQTRSAWEVTSSSDRAAFYCHRAPAAGCCFYAQTRAGDAQVPPALSLIRNVGWESGTHLWFQEQGHVFFFFFFFPVFFFKFPKWLQTVPGRSSSASLWRTELGQAGQTPFKEVDFRCATTSHLAFAEMIEILQSEGIFFHFAFS